MKPHWCEDYEVAPRDYSLAMARGTLARLYGTELELVAAAPHGRCDDCERSSLGTRLEYGKFSVCRRCALLRRQARGAA